MEDIRVNSVTKGFGDKKVLDAFSCTFRQGETACIMGRSGCGKTTLLNLLMGLLKPDAGEITGMPGHISPVFQEDRLCEGLSLEQNIRLCSREPILDETLNIHIRETGLEEAGGKPVRELSGGMKRRAAILRAVLSGGNLLILDEPFKGLDELTRQKTAEYFKKYTRGKTVIMVTHDPEEVSLMGGQLIEMKGAEHIDSNEK